MRPNPSPKLPRRLLDSPLPLLLVLALALALRVWGLTWGLPSATHYFSYHPDETVVLDVASRGMNVFAGRLLPHYYNYGSLQFYLVCFANTLAALSGAVDIVPKDYAVWYPQWAKMYLIGRCLTVGMGVGTVWATYALGCRLWGRRAGLLAGLVLAIMPLHAQHSHFLTVDVPGTLWATLSLVWAARLLTGDPRPLRAALWAGVFAGLAAATKYNLALVFLPVLAACVMRMRQKEEGAASKKGAASSAPAFVSFLAPPLLGAGGAVLAFLAACPGAMLENAKFLADIRYEAAHVQNADDPTFKDTGSGFVYHITHNLDAGLGLPLLCLALASVGYALCRRQRGDGLLAAFALPYYVLIGLAAVKYARYVIPLLPILALWTGRLLADASRLTRPALRFPALGAGAVVLALTLLNSSLLLEPMARQDPRDAALAQINTASPSATVGFGVLPWFGTVPISPYFTQPYPGFWRKEVSPENAARIIYTGTDWDTAVLAKRPDYVVLSEYDYVDALRVHNPAAVRFVQALTQGGYQMSGNLVALDPLAILDGLPTQVSGLPTHGLPHDMLYTNPTILIYERRH